MEDVLKKMNPEKRENLINAAMKEFGENRFEKASTNAIVKEAGISKGLLYHYFKTKDELYEYLMEYAMNAVAGPIAEKIGTKERDIIKRIEDITKLKLEIVGQYPYMVSFSKVMFAGMPYDEIVKIIEKYHPIPLEMYYQHNIDESLFKDGINHQMAISNIQFTLEKLSDGYIIKRQMGIEPDLDVIMDEIMAYLNHFRSIYYKEETK